MARHDPRAGDWYLHRLEGGDAVLEANMSKDPSKLTCPKCLAPMLSIGENQVICYACGMTFDVKGERVSRTLRKDEVERLLSSPTIILGEGIQGSPSAKTDRGKRRISQ
jgi:hypothetical protein